MKPIDFEDYLSEDIKAQIITERVQALAVEGFQHQMNLDFILKKLDSVLPSTEVRESLNLERGRLVTQIEDIKDVIRWTRDNYTRQ